MKYGTHIVCALGLACQLGNVMALPPCPETGYFHNCFGTRTYLAKPGFEVSKASEAFKELEREIEQARKKPSDEQVVPSAPQLPTYVGEFKDDKRDGYGVFKGGGIHYEGSWKDDVKSGQGLLTQHGYSMAFIGEFKDGKRLGLGQLLLTNGDIYVGQFDDGAASKSLVHSQNNIVVEWFDSGISGEGVLTYADGRIGLGEWKGGLPHGLFIEFGTDRKVRSAGIYFKGKLYASENVSPDDLNDVQILPVCIGSDAKQWSRCFGTVDTSTDVERSTYEGDFQDGDYNGRGKYVYETKGLNVVSGVYRGEFKNRQFHGIGILRFDDGRVQIGDWREGKPVRLFVDTALDRDITESYSTNFEAY